MKALSIQQPFASMLMRPDSHPDAKRVENRFWFTEHRGPLVIHASRQRYSGPGGDKLPYGCLLGVMEQVACLPLAKIRSGQVPPGLEWLAAHRHVEGPWCHVLVRPEPFMRPAPYRGQLKHFEVPDALVDAELVGEGAPPEPMAGLRMEAPRQPALSWNRGRVYGDARRRSGLSVVMAASRLGVSPWLLSAIEHGTARPERLLAEAMRQLYGMSEEKSDGHSA